jgi:hypothetical protein
MLCRLSIRLDCSTDDQTKYSYYSTQSRRDRAVFQDPSSEFPYLPSLPRPPTVLADAYEQYLNLDNGFYVFPPNPEGLVKVAIHNAGYTNPSTRHDGAIDGQGEGEGKKVSVPRTKLTPGAQDGFIPKAMIEELRVGLRDIFPELAAKDFEGTRLCWYVQVPFFTPRGK